MPSTIADYAIIGDGRSCALVARTGSIDFLCWPSFDSDACFAALLGDERHGFWRIAPTGGAVTTSRRYRGDTTILETEHDVGNGRVRVTDLMPWHDGHTSIIRIVEGIAGEVEMTLAMRLRFGNGQIAPWTQTHERGLIFEVGPDRVLLDSPVELTIGDNDANAVFSIKAGDSLAFILRHSPSTAPLADPLEAQALASATESAWLDWINQFEQRGQWDATIRRSLITLRTLFDRVSGGIAAAATFGLPEVPGGTANWDYRYCWLRDSTFTLTALLNAGFHGEAKRWRDWILRAIAGQPSAMQIVYKMDGGRRLPEYQVDGLPGYQGAKPVRVGNAASAQMQLDVFGELMDSFDVLAKAGIERTQRIVEIEIAIVEHIEKAWDKPSSDIWEMRSEPRCFIYSQAMAWVGISRFVEAHAEDERVDRNLIARLKALRETIHRTVCDAGYRSDLGHFVQSQGSDTLDASLLLLPIIGFLPIDDPRIAGTIAAIERNLMEKGFVRRMPWSPDAAGEGVFLVCSCWLADCFKMQGRETEASALLDRVVAVANDVGLLAEEYHPGLKTQIGNIPQALTHLGIINTALRLSGPMIERDGK